MPLLEKFKQLLISIYHLSSRNKINYVFYSEKENYKYYFLPLINKLINENQEIYYLSSDLDDLKPSNNLKVKNFYIGKGFIRMIILSLIKCKYFFMTITDLGNNEFFKSKKIKNYVYIFHALQSTHKIYTEKAFDNYDIICCNGNYQYEEIKIREEKFNFSEKKLVKSGYLYLEYLKSNINLSKDKNFILFAPSWNYNNFNLLEQFSIKILNQLLKDNFKVIFRPHQEHYKRSKNKIDEIFLKFKKNSNLIIDQSPNNLKSFEQSNFLISDYSGIVHEFLYICKKPFLVFNDLKKIHNEKYFQIKDGSFEEDVYKKFGFFINSSNIEDIKENIIKAKLEFNDKEKEIESFFSERLFLKPKASETIFNEIINH